MLRDKCKQEDEMTRNIKRYKNVRIISLLFRTALKCGLLLYESTLFLNFNIRKEVTEGCRTLRN